MGIEQQQVYENKQKLFHENSPSSLWSLGNSNERIRTAKCL